jgi:acyl-coenzyme A thioesterase PaaI-like protein
VTAEYRISFLSPAIGDVLIARGEVIKPGRSIIHTKCDVAVRAGDRETLVATALSSMVPFTMPIG